MTLCEEILLVVHSIVQSVSFVDGSSTAHVTGCGSGCRLSVTNLQCCLERERVTAALVMFMLPCSLLQYIV